MELSIEQLIKIVIGVLVIVVVIGGLVFFGNYIGDFFRNAIPGNVSG
jgi:uncharacterized membrane protein